jgi:hypothetical protein
MALTKYNYNSFDLTTAASKGLAFNSDADGFTTVTEGSIVLIKTLTASSSSNLTFVDGTSDVVLDDTYTSYMFKFINLNFSNDASNFQVNFRDGGSSYDASKTTNYGFAYHDEDDGNTGATKDDSMAIDAATSVAVLGQSIGNGGDESLSGSMYLFNPASTTFQKQFISSVNYYQSTDRAENAFVGGYCDVTAAIDAVQFTPSAGTFDTGDIKLYGIKDS